MIANCAEGLCLQPAVRVLEAGPRCQVVRFIGVVGIHADATGWVRPLAPVDMHAQTSTFNTGNCLVWGNPGPAVGMQVVRMWWP